MKRYKRLNGKNTDYPRPRLEAIKISKYQVSKMKNTQSARSINVEVKSEYLSNVPPPNGRGPVMYFE